MRMGVKIVQRHSFHLHSRPERGFSGWCGCGYKGPWRGDPGDAQHDWEDHIRIETNEQTSEWTCEYLLAYVKLDEAGVYRDFGIWDIRTPYFVSLSREVFGNGISVPGMS